MQTHMHFEIYNQTCKKYTYQAYLGKINIFLISNWFINCCATNTSLTLKGYASIPSHV